MNAVLARARRAAPVAFAAAVLVGATVDSFRTWYPHGDLAVFGFRLDDLASHPPLVGAYSRYGWSHPGPLLYYALWAPYQAVGGGARGLLVATLCWHALGAAACLWFAGRRGGLPLQATTAIVVVLTAVVAGGDALLQPWNPFLNFTIVPLFVLASWSMVEGDRWGPVAAVVSGTALVQNHLGLAVPVFAVAAVAVATTVARRRRLDVGWRLWAAAFGAGVVAWAPPLLQIQRADPDNLNRVMDFFSDRGDGAGLRVAIRLGAQTLGLQAAWLGVTPATAWLEGGLEPRSGLAAWPVLGLVPLAALVVSIRSRRWDRMRLLLLGATLVASGTLATASITDAVFPYLLNWLDVASAAFVLTGAWVLAADLAPRLAPSRLLAHRDLVATGVVGVASMTLTALLIVAPDPYEDRGPVFAELTRGALATLGPTPGTVVFAASPPGQDFAVTGVMYQLERRGWTTYADPFYANMLGTWRVRTPTASDVRVLMVAESGSIDKLARDPKWRRIAYYQPFTAEELRRLTELDTKIAAEHDDPSKKYEVLGALDELLKIRRGRTRVALYERLDPTATAPSL